MMSIGLFCALFFRGGTLPALAAAGTNNAISLISGTITARGSYQFSFTANAGQAYPISVSADLVYWSLLTNVIGTNGQLWFTDLDSPNFPQRFYQIAPATLTNMVFIRPGTFTMGSPASEVGHDSTEAPQTVVTISRAFWMGTFEVTQNEYVAVMGTNVSEFNSDPRLPAELISWTMATDYCAALTIQERAAGRLPPGYAYRLPTEAEWEYACRAGTTTPFGIGDGTDLSSAQANFDGTFPYGAAPSGQFLNRTTLPGTYVPNAWGLHDMHGNVWEWCRDWYGPYPGGSVTDPTGPATGSSHVLRGGGYDSLGQGCRSAVRDYRSPIYRSSLSGFRVVLASAL
jgi:sulfatase modifying factor 1